MTASTPTTSKVAIVTGAGTGVGRGIALEITRAGWRVAIGGRRVDRLNETAAEIEALGGSVFVHVLDVTNAASVDAFFAAAEDALGPVDALVNNAGMAIPGYLEETAPEDIERVFLTNTVGAFYCTRAALRSMKPRGAGGDIVFISSDTAELPVPLNAMYGASKAALENASRAFGIEFEGTGIRSTVLRLGPTISEFGFGWDPEKAMKISELWARFRYYHGGVLEPADVGRAVVDVITKHPRVHVDTVWVRPAPPEGDPGESSLLHSDIPQES